MLIKKLLYKYAKFIKFCFVGLAGTIVDFGLLNLLVYFKINVYLAASISFLAAATNNYFFNKIWTFKYNGNKKAKIQYLQFLIVSTAGLLINLGIMYALIEGFGLWYNWAKLAAVAVVMFWNYFVNKYWTFEDHKRAELENEDNESIKQIKI